MRHISLRSFARRRVVAYALAVLTAAVVFAGSGAAGRAQQSAPQTGGNAVTVSLVPMTHILNPGALPADEDGVARQPSNVAMSEGAPLAISAGLIINATFDSTITTDPNAAAIESAINTAISNVQSMFSDPITVNITFSKMPSGLGQSSTFFGNLSYATFLAALKGDAKTSDDAVATSFLPNVSTNPVNGSTTINVKTANLRAVGIAASLPSDGTISLNTTITSPGSPGSTATYNLIPVAAHEINEVLGLGSALPSPPSSTIFPQDLYRYSAVSTRTFTTANSLAFFSINGSTFLAQFDNQNAGGDFGDWQSNPRPAGVPAKVQDAFATPGAAPALSAELNALDVIGYDRVTVSTAPPTVVTAAATGIGTTSATLNGTANPNGLATSANFEYGVTPAYGSTTPVQAMGSGNVALPIGGGTITGLTCGTTYHFRATAANIIGTTPGSNFAFTTSPCTPPTVTTGMATSVGILGATLNGTANPNGAATTAYFQYGPTAGYGSTTPVQSVGSGVMAVSIGGGVVNLLTCNTLYHFRAVAVSVGGTVFGGDATFMTSPCTLATGSSTSQGFVYALDQVDGGLNMIIGFRLNAATGVFTPLSGFPVASGGIGSSGTGSEAIAFDRLNARLYVINDGDDTLSAFSVNHATGALMALPFSPIALPVPASGAGAWSNVQAHPSGSPVVVGDGNGNIASFVVTATTATAAMGSPYATIGSAAFSGAFSRDGNYFYSGGNIGVAIGGFSVAPATGVLTPLGGSPFSSGNSFPVAYVTDSAGRLFSTNANSNQVRVFTTSGGVPSAVTGNPFSAGGLSVGVHGVMHPAGFYMVADRGFNKVGVYQVAGSGSATTLSAVSGSPFATGGSFTDALALTNDGGILIAANGKSRNLTLYGVDSSMGTMSPLMILPANTLGSAGLITGLVFAKMDPAFGDVDGDGKSDLLLRNKVTGGYVGWLMNGLTITNSAFLATVADLNWELKGVGDLDGDGKADVIIRNKVTGGYVGWLLNGLTIANSGFLATVADLNWELKGVGDLDGDGKADLVVRNKVTGGYVGWLMNGLTITNSALLATVADTNWEMVGMGDLDGDGKADIVLRNKVTGGYVGWLMNGLTITNSAFLATVADLNWELKGVGDLDGDGKVDIVLRNKVTGGYVGWLMNGLTIVNSGFLATVADTNWEMVGLGDLDGDGKADITIRNKVTGAVVGWLMNGLTITNSAFLATVADTNWEVVGQGQ